MTFEDALVKVLETEKQKEKEEGITLARVEDKTLKHFSLFWNMLAVSGGKLDDLAYITSRGDIVSIPLSDKKKKEEKDKPE